MTALEASVVVVGRVVSSYLDSVLGEADSEGDLSGVDLNPEPLGEDLAVEPVVVALDYF